MNATHFGLVTVTLAVTLLTSPIALDPIRGGSRVQDRPAKPASKKEAKALAILAADVGEWHCKWERLDANGKVVHTFEGTETFEYVFKPRVLRLTTHVPSRNSRSVGLKFFEPISQKIRFLNVDDKGDFWDMEEGIDDLRVTSQPHKNADGSTMSIRFSVLKKTEDSRRVLMEYTLDGGVTWTKGNYQTMTRKRKGKKFTDTPRR